MKREMTVLMSDELGGMLKEVICYSDYYPEINQQERGNPHKKCNFKCVSILQSILSFRDLLKSNTIPQSV